MSIDQVLQRERNKLRAIQEIARAIGSTLELDPLLHLIVATTTALMEAERSTLYLVDADAGQLWTRVVEGGDLREIRLVLGEGIAGWVAKTGVVVNIPDAYADERFSPAVDRRSGYHTRSILCVPLRDQQGATIGVIQVLNKRRGVFDREDEELLLALGAQAALALENSRLYASVLSQNEALRRTQQALERRMSELALLLEVQQQLAAATSLDELLLGLLTLTERRLRVEAAGILLRLPAGDRLYCSATPPTGGAPVLLGAPVAQAEGLAGWVAEHRQALSIDDATAEGRFVSEVAQRRALRPQSVLCVPLRGQEEAVGALELVNRQDGAVFDAADLQVVTLIAGRVAPAIELARYREQRLREERLVGVGHLLAGVLHDLRTPMTVISGFAQLMVDADQPTRAAYAENILSQFEVMAAMIREVLCFARGESQLLVRKVYLRKFMREIEEHLRHELAERPIALQFDLAYQGTAHFDENKLRRALHNLARNAVQAMPQGGRLTLAVAASEGQLLLSCSDTGLGVPEEVRDRLFEAFATAGKVDGSGLGLAIVKRIVDEHGGTVRCDSRAGEGTTFTIALPLRGARPTGG
ncbi:MAG: GAF domain-containing sensor histidine kinase [Proteobacteria bacterium]|nr:GAF domain-containing sensor histidine kinase [Pseudomonadota bacterium]